MWAVSESVFRQIDPIFETLPDDDVDALLAIDRADKERIAARRRYEEFVDAPSSSRWSARHLIASGPPPDDSYPVTAPGAADPAGRT
jgi:hypothetical protein